MKVILLSIAVALVLGYAAFFVLSDEQRPAYEAFSTSSVRVGEPSHNLVGPDWSGLNEAPTS
jgi:hypothetical protein